jgi:hypothetical protein
MSRRRSLPFVVAALAAGLAGMAHGDRSAAAASCSRKVTCSLPSAPTNLVARAASTDSIAFSWSPSVPSGGSITGYRVLLDGRLVGTTAATSYTFTGLACGTSHALAVAAVDSRGAVSAQAQTFGSTLACQAPTSSSWPVWAPAPGTTWQWQITGTVDQTVLAQMFDVDLFDAQPGEINAGVIESLHALNVKVICYVDTGAWESYRPDASRFPQSVIGNSTGWDGEYWLDIRPQSWPLFEPLVVGRMKLAAQSGCDGVEPDQNNPVGNDPGFPISNADEKAWYLEVARQAHALGLSVGMKNGIEIVDGDLVSAFDWALNEECFQYDECNALSRFITARKAVFQVEYQGDPAQFCPAAKALGFSSMKKRLRLDAWRVTCW